MNDHHFAPNLEFCILTQPVSLSLTNSIVLILCNLSASLTNKTLMSFEVAKINFLKFSALELDDALFSSADIFVTPST